MEQIKKTRHTRITISSIERMTVWRIPKQTDVEQISENVLLVCPHCGEKVFWVEVKRKPDIEVYEEILNKE